MMVRNNENRWEAFSHSSCFSNVTFVQNEEVSWDKQCCFFGAAEGPKTQ